MGNAFENMLLPPGFSVGGEEVTAGLRADLGAFSGYVRREIVVRELYGVIVRTLSEQRPDEVISDIDIAGGKVGLEVAKLTGIMPTRRDHKIVCVNSIP